MLNRLRASRTLPVDVAWISAGVLLIWLYLGPALLPGSILLPGDLLFEDPLWSTAAPFGFQDASNQLLVDQVYQFYPWRQFAQAELQQGRWPLWNPLVYAGTPLIANDQSAVFYPINLLLVWLPTYLIPGWSAFLRLLIAFGGMYALLRRWQHSPGAGFVGGMSFALGCFMVTLLGHPHTNVGALIPLMLLTADGVATSVRPCRWMAWGGVVIGVQFLGGHAETSFFGLMLWGIYGLVVLIMSGKSVGEQGGRLGLAFVVGSGLAAIQLLPFLELLPQSNYFLFRTEEAQSQPWLYMGFWRNAALAITLFLPDFFGNPTRSGWWIGTGFANYTNVLYTGIVPIFLAGLTILGARRSGADWRLRFFALFGLIWLGIILRLPGLDLVRRLPLFDISAISLAVFGVLFAILAGYGFDALFAPDEAARSTPRRMRWAFVAFAVLAGGGMVAGYGVLRLFKNFFMDLGRVYVEEHIYGNPPHPFSLAHYLDQLDVRYQQVVAAFDPGQVWAYVPVLIALGIGLVLWLWEKEHLNRVRAQSLVGLLVFVDLWAFGAGFNPVMPADQLFPPTSALAFLGENQGQDRMVALGDLLPANTAMPYGLPDIRGYDVTIDRYIQLLDSLDRTPLGLIHSQHNDHFFDLMGVRYLVSAQELEPSSDMTLVYAGQVNVYERSDRLPRTYLAGSVTVIEEDDLALDALWDVDVAAGRRVILEETSPIALPSMLGNLGQSEFLTYQADLVEIIVDTPVPALLVLTDAHYPGWRATVDDDSVPILRANYAFRAVPVPGGTHTVRFEYRPRSFQIGGWISLISLGLLMVLSMISTRRSRDGDDSGESGL